MPPIDDDRQEAEMPNLAVKALNAAYRRAIQAGHTLVLVKDGDLVQIEATTGKTTVLKRLPKRKQVTTRTKIARS